MAPNPQVGAMLRRREPRRVRHPRGLTRDDREDAVDVAAAAARSLVQSDPCLFFKAFHYKRKRLRSHVDRRGLSFGVVYRVADGVPLVLGTCGYHACLEPVHCFGRGSEFHAGWDVLAVVRLDCTPGNFVTDGAQVCSRAMEIVQVLPRVVTRRLLQPYAYVEGDDAGGVLYGLHYKGGQLDSVEDNWAVHEEFFTTEKIAAVAASRGWWTCWVFSSAKPAHVVYEAWYREGRLHRAPDQPAVVVLAYSADAATLLYKREEFWVRGSRTTCSTQDRPAVMWWDGKGDCWGWEHWDGTKLVYSWSWPNYPQPAFGSSSWRLERDGEQYFCPISLQPITDPVCTRVGSVYDQSSLLAMQFEGGGPPSRDPYTNQPLPTVGRFGCWFWDVPWGLFVQHERAGTVCSDLRRWCIYRAVPWQIGLENLLLEVDPADVPFDVGNVVHAGLREGEPEPEPEPPVPEPGLDLVPAAAAHGPAPTKPRCHVWVAVHVLFVVCLLCALLYAGSMMNLHVATRLYRALALLRWRVVHS